MMYMYLRVETTGGNNKIHIFQQDTKCYLFLKDLLVMTSYYLAMSDWSLFTKNNPFYC